MRSPDIALTSEERTLFDRIEFDQGRASYATVQANGDLVERLFDLLTARDALPKQRIQWFTDAKFNPGGRGQSR